ncbi:MAG: efflux RND transporter periplasmic adaptor subunit [Gammaproteobacteria bacterium]|nr:efflux RND transporter periplasmic adaptor subunit [Gammaproteobacteria bacterium]
MQAVLISAAAFAGSALAIDVPELDCVIEPHIVIDLSSRTDGIVETIEVDRGDIVTEGDVVVRLESGVEEAAVDYARAAATADSELQARELSMSFAERRRGRLESLYREQVLSSDQMDEMETEARLSQFELDEARERRRLAQLELRQALEVLERHTITSPIDGVVVQRFLAPGESVEEKPILRLAQIDPLRVEVIVPVSYFGAIQPSQRAVVMPEQPMDGQYNATVTVVDRVADAASGTFRVRMSLPNPDYKLPSGLKCTVRFLPGVVAAPATAAKAQPKGKSAKPAPDRPTPAPKQESSKRKNEPTAVPHAGVSTSSQPVAAPATERLDTTAIDEVLRARQGVPATPTTNSQPPPSDTEALAAACRTIGPFEDEQSVTEIKATLTGHVNQLSVRREAVNTRDGFVIVSEQQESVAAAKALAEQMQVAGVHDLFVFGRGPYKGRVSLGLYKGPRMAEERVREVISLGFAAEAIPRDSLSAQYFVDVELKRGSTESAMPEPARQLLAGKNAAPSDCNQVLASRQ